MEVILRLGRGVGGRRNIPFTARVFPFPSPPPLGFHLPLGFRPATMSGGAGAKAAAAATAIPAAAKKLVQGVKEIVNCTEAEIYAMLKECGMDPDEAASSRKNVYLRRMTRRGSKRYEEVYDDRQGLEQLLHLFEEEGKEEGREFMIMKKDPETVREQFDKLDMTNNPRTGSAARRNGTPAQPLSTNEYKKLDNTLRGGPAKKKIR